MGLTGAFMVVGPLGRKLGIIANDSSQWLAEGMPGDPWEHVSVSTERPDRTPTWAEMDYVKDLFWGPDEAVAQLHVPKADHVNVFPGCLHLWRPVSGWPMLPPKECV